MKLLLVGKAQDIRVCGMCVIGAVVVVVVLPPTTPYPKNSSINRVLLSNKIK